MNPLHQFEVHAIHALEVGGFNLSITNQTLWMAIAVATVSFIMLWGVRSVRLVPGRAQAFVELTYEFIHKLVKDGTGEEGLKFFPLILTLFLFIASMNLTGMIPGSYTATSQFITTLTMGLCVFALVVFMGFWVQGLHFLQMFFPKGTPLYLAPLIIPLELISFFVRPLTLATRLAVNMVAGHILVKLFATFIVMMMGWFALSALLPFVVLMLIMALELFVALLQAYIFTVLTCVYLHDALHGH